MKPINYYLEGHCPVCGNKSESTSPICPKHIVFTYDGNGKLIDYQDWRYFDDYGNILEYQKPARIPNIRAIKES